MSSSTSLGSDQVPRTSPRSGPVRYFYSIASILILVLSLIGFRKFYFEGRSYPDREITPPIKGLVIAHGASMTLWLLLFIAQPMLVATRRLRIHMKLGWVGAGLSALIVALGFITATYSTRVAPAGTMFGPLTAKQFMVVPYTGMTLFALYVGIAVWYRKRPEIHKPLMFLATIGTLAAALDRIDSLQSLYRGTLFDRIWGSFFSSLVLALILLIIKSALTRSFDKWYAAGLAGLLLVTCAMVQLAPTQAWDSFASLFVP